MQNGTFITYYLPYRDNDTAISPKEQAKRILANAKALIEEGTKGVAITYSANYGQTRKINKTYTAGDCKTGTDGLNQAGVMKAMETLLEQETFRELKCKVRIAPVTTMNALADPVNPWNEGVLLHLVEKDLKNIQKLLDAGWDVLGWQNQDTIDNSAHPYAVGGGVATLPKGVSEKIQNTLISFSKTYV